MREVAARSDGKVLHLTMNGVETTYAWEGPAGAHHARITDGERKNHAYGSELVVEISVYDADGNFLGSLSQSEWS